MFKRIYNFINKIITEINNDDLFSAANDMTYKLFFSIFPFLIFLMSVVGFLKLDIDNLTSQISSLLPYSLNEPVSHFIKEIASVKNANILSFSLIISIYGASSGFKTAMRSINKTYGVIDTRKFYIKIPISIALVLIFTVIIIFSFVLLIFGDNILNYAISIIIMFFSVILINKLALYKNKKNGIKSHIPGTIFTVSLWITISRLFNIYIDNFTNYSAVYGSIAAVIILMLWLNIMCIVLLVGNEINAAIFS
jgi:membrane protein